MTQPSDQVLGHARRAAAAVLFWIFIVSAGINLLMLTSPFYMLQVYDRVIAARHVDTLVLLSIMAAAALVVFSLLDGIRAIVGLRLGAWFERRLAPAVVSATVSAAQISGGGRGVPALRDLSTVRSLFAGGGIWPLLDAPWSVLFYGIVFLIHPLLGWCGIAGGVLLLLIAIANEFASRHQLQAAGQRTMRSVGEADAAIRNADAMLAMGMLPSFLRRWEKLHLAAQRHQSLAGQRSAALGSLAKGVRVGLQVATLGLGAYLSIRSEMMGGAMVAASIIVARAVAPLEQAIGTWRSIINAQTAWKRLRDLLSAPGRTDSQIRLPRPAGALAVERATYGARLGVEPIVNQVSFALAQGESVAIVGPSGSGKTTLLRMLVGSLAPQSGTIRLDGAPITAWMDADKARYVGYLPQDVELFNATVRDNIARFVDASDAEVVAAAMLAGAHETILRLPQGYATSLGPGGIVLSGGQRQRVGLARAVFGDPRLVVLDEPNAHLDADGEQALLAAIRALKQRQVTVVLVAQRPSVATEVDQVLRLRDGRVEAFGSREGVLRRVANGGPAPAAAQAPGRVLRVSAAGGFGGND